MFMAYPPAVRRRTLHAPRTMLYYLCAAAARVVRAWKRVRIPCGPAAVKAEPLAMPLKIGKARGTFEA